ncbi:hypothetical protein QA612_09970 [Evansella sp. AB-P1]|uniref:hypothetical protein n=1 Tax=Evansella sp. AB-P1 TaxID=3037653 RepID=UPI00241C5DF6|nr:hypothetical protein [Evansella sp. AB-P1]MDG5787824.1 hypothetical protein [Evansella sp. AB-P1]
MEYRNSCRKFADSLDINVYENTFFITEREGNIVELENQSFERFPVETSDPIVHVGEG